MKSAKLQTNLLGRKIHFLTDQEAKIEVSRQDPKMEKELLDTLTAESVYPVLKYYRKRFGDQSGEIVVVRVSKEDYLVYTVSFGGELVELHPHVWRLDPV